MSAPLEVDILTGPEQIATAIENLAQLRITVFREWPYLYDGTLDYEREYLEKFAASPGSIVVAARDRNRMVGASTGMPLDGEHEEFVAPFTEHGLDPADIFYCAESVLLAPYRGRGLGHRFFDEREAHARRLGGFRYLTFCGVIRPEDHPLRPADYRPLDAFWRKRGYAPVPGLIGQFPWRDIGEEEETPKPMQFWMRPIDEPAADTTAPAS